MTPKKRVLSISIYLFNLFPLFSFLSGRVSLSSVTVIVNELKLRSLTSKQFQHRGAFRYCSCFCGFIVFLFNFTFIYITEAADRSLHQRPTVPSGANTSSRSRIRVGGQNHLYASVLHWRIYCVLLLHIIPHECNREHPRRIQPIILIWNISMQDFYWSTFTVWY